MNADETLPLLHLLPRPDLGILIGRWGYQPDPAELLAAYDALTEAVQRTPCRFWLQDIRRRSLNDPATTQWLLTDYFPDMARRLGGRLCVAYLVGPALHRTILESPGFAALSADDSQPFTMGFFGDEGAAIEWLQSQQGADASGRSG